MQEEAARVDEAMRKKQRQEAIARTVLSMEEAGASQSAGTAVTCAICQEAFDSFFDEEAEEWMFRNAVKAPESGRVVHATCLVEASAEPVLSPVEGGKRGREGDASDGEKGREKGDVEPPSSKQRRKVK